ncbi:MAG: flagellar protein FlaG, partial [Eubacteriales bacterium]
MSVQGVSNNSYVPPQQAIVNILPGDPGNPEEEARPSDQPGVRENLTRQGLEKAVGKANNIMESCGTELHFSIHEASGEMMVKIVNKKDNSVIREIPPERILNFVAHVKK